MPTLTEAASSPQILGAGRDVVATALGTSGAFLLTWQVGGQINVQRFGVDGRPLDPNPYRYSAGTWVRTTALGHTGEFVVVSGDGQSVYVQKFDATGSPTAAARVVLNGARAGGTDNWPEVCALGSGGEFAVTWYGLDNDSASTNDFSIFVQKFAADGTTGPHQRVKLEAIGNSVGFDSVPRILPVGNEGEYLVVWEGAGADGKNAVYLQRFNSDGTTTGNSIARVAAISGEAFARGTALGDDGAFVLAWANAGDIYVQRFSADGSAATYPLVRLGAASSETRPILMALPNRPGEFVVAWDTDSSGAAVFVQHFNADGTTTGHALASLRATGVSNRTNSSPKLAALPNGGYVVSWYGVDETGDYSVYVQRFDADGVRLGTTPVKLEALNQPNYNDQAPVVTAVGPAGEFVVGYNVTDPWGANSQAYLQRFNADGTLWKPQTYVAGDLIHAAADAAGTLYLARADALADGTTKPWDLPDDQVNSVAVTQAGQFLPIPVAGLTDGTYRIGFADGAGNLSSPSGLSYLVTGSPAPSIHIIGAPRQGRTLEAEDSPGGNEGTTIVYQWKADGIEIAGATARTFTPTRDQVGQSITVAVSFIAPTGESTSAVSEATTPVISAALGGKVQSWSSLTSLDDVEISFREVGAPDATPLAGIAVSDRFGVWLLDDLDFGQFDLEAFKPVSPSDALALTSADAMAALKIAMGRNPNPDPDGPGPMEAEPLSAYQLIAADINRDGRVTRDDAQTILAHAHGIGSGAMDMPLWRFVAASQDLSAATAPNVPTIAPISPYADVTSQVTLVGVLLGDVNGSWKPI